MNLKVLAAIHLLVIAMLGVLFFITEEPIGRWIIGALIIAVLGIVLSKKKP